MSEEKKGYKKTARVFNLFKKGETAYLKLDTSKYGVKSMIVELNDGTKVDVTGKSTFFLNDPRDKLKRLVESGKIDGAYAEKQIARADELGRTREVDLLID